MTELDIFQFFISEMTYGIVFGIVLGLFLKVVQR